MSYISSCRIPHFWIRSNLRISRRSFALSIGASIAPFSFPMADFPARTSKNYSEKSEQRGTPIAGRSSRALRTMSMSITRVTGYEESRVTIARKGCINHQGSNSIDLWKGGGSFRSSRVPSRVSHDSRGSSSLLSSLPVHEEHACNTTCWGWNSDPLSVNSCARRAQARDGKCVTVRPRW